MKRRRSTTKEELIIACKDSNGPAQVLKKLGLSENGACRSYLKKNFERIWSSNTKI